jgi:hypothetical protein
MQLALVWKLYVSNNRLSETLNVMQLLNGGCSLENDGIKKKNMRVAQIHNKTSDMDNM